jgi:hypothetical protein
MDILIVLISIALLGFACFWALIFGFIGLSLIWVSWPSILGVVGGAYIWWSVSDNLGVLFAIACFIGQAFWSKKLPAGSGGRSSNPMSGKIKVYDQKGNVKGYIDK